VIDAGFLLISFLLKGISAHNDAGFLSIERAAHLAIGEKIQNNTSDILPFHINKI